MRPFLSTFGLLFSATLAAPAPEPASSDPAVLRKKLAALEDRIALLQREAAAVRQQLDKVAPPKPAILTPQEAVEVYKKNPNQPVTVEFGVTPGSGEMRTGLSGGEAIWAIWDGQLAGGGTFSAVLRSKAYQGLKIPSKEKGKPGIPPSPGQERTAVGRHIDENGLRVTGLIRKNTEASWLGDYVIVVEEPSNIVLFHSINPRPLPRR